MPTITTPRPPQAGHPYMITVSPNDGGSPMRFVLLANSIGDAVLLALEKAQEHALPGASDPCEVTAVDLYAGLSPVARALVFSIYAAMGEDNRYVDESVICVLRALVDKAAGNYWHVDQLRVLAAELEACRINA